MKNRKRRPGFDLSEPATVAVERPNASVMSRLLPAGFAALCVMTPLIPTEADAYQGTSIILAVAWLLWLLTWSAACFLNTGITARFSRWDALWLLLVIWLSMSTWQATRTGNARLAWNDWSRWMLILTMPFLCRQILVHPLLQRCLVLIMISLAVVCAGHGYHQVLYSMPRMRQAYEQNPDGTLRDLGIHAPPGSALRYQFENRLRSPEPLSTFALTNSLAGFLLPWLALAAHLATRATRERGSRQFTMTLALVVLLIVGCFWLTNSRSAHAAFVLGASWTVWKSYPRRQRIGLGLFLTVCGAGLFVLAWTGHLPDGAVKAAWQSLGYRWEYWRATLSMIADYPWLGCGPGQFQDTYMAYKLPEASETIADPHNWLLEIAAVLGLPALIGAAGWGVGSLLPAMSRSTEPSEQVAHDDAAARATARGMLLGALGGLLAAYPLGLIVGFPPDTVLVWLGLPLAIGCVAQGWDWVQQGTLPSAWLRGALLMIAIHLLAAGGISFAGVSISWAVLWGILAVRAAPSPRWGFPRWGMLVSLLLFAVAVHKTYQPTLRVRKAMQTSEMVLEKTLAAPRRSPAAWEQVVQAFELAQSLDQLSPEPAIRLAAVCHMAWLGEETNTPDKTVWRERFEHYAAMTLELQPRSYAAQRQVALWYIAAYRTFNDSALLAHGLEAAQQAVTRYSHHAAAHADLAWFAHLAGDQVRAHQAARRAQELDRLHPHAEHDLTRYPLPDPGPAESWRNQQPAGPPSPTAEACLTWLLENG